MSVMGSIPRKFIYFAQDTKVSKNYVGGTRQPDLYNVFLSHVVRPSLEAVMMTRKRFSL